MALTVLLPPPSSPFLSTSPLSSPTSHRPHCPPTSRLHYPLRQDYFLTPVPSAIHVAPPLVVVYESIVETVTILLCGIVGVLRLVDTGGGICPSDCGGCGYHSITDFGFSVVDCFAWGHVSSASCWMGPLGGPMAAFDSCPLESRIFDCIYELMTVCGAMGLAMSLLNEA
eukprot:CCRYP_020596-RA/>CCRYP_020596-RA protein AED:0.59 eAED:1.00 QI:0/0/0/1/0/0/2/0/169